MIQHRKQFRSVTDLFENQAEILISLAKDNCVQLRSICDVQQVDDEEYFRVDNEKIMSWLQLKVDAVCSELEKKSISTSTQSVGLENLKFLGSNESSNSTDRVRYACSLLVDYLPSELATQLHQKLQIADSVSQPSHAPVPGASSSSSNGKAAPKEDYFISEKYGMKVDEPKLTRSQKQLAKVDKKGMKPIKSFFTTKPK